MHLTATRDVLVEVDIEGADEIGGSGRRATDHYVLRTASRTNLNLTIDGKLNLILIRWVKQIYCQEIGITTYPALVTM